MKIGILTFHASHNFGSMLQNYALQRFLLAEGHVVETINLRNKNQKILYRFPLFLGRTNPSLLKLFGRIRDPKWLIIACKRWFIFENFMKKNLILTKEHKQWASIKHDVPRMKYDAIIVGGDQIWNPVCFDFDWSYFLPDFIGPIKKIAYCPSFGNSIPRIEENIGLTSTMKRYLGDFDSISVREEDASEFLQRLLNRVIPVVADPTLLVAPSIYQNLIGERIINDPYIYYYAPSHVADLEAETTAESLAKKLGLKIVTSYPRFMGKGSMKGVVSGPAEFLNLLSNAQIVLGMSYHLVVFSVIFHKDFITLKCRNDSRINSFLNQLRITGRNMESIEDYNHLVKINYSSVDEELRKIRNDSASFLLDALS